MIDEKPLPYEISSLFYWTLILRIGSRLGRRRSGGFRSDALRSRDRVQNLRCQLLGAPRAGFRDNLLSQDIFLSSRKVARKVD